MAGTPSSSTFGTWMKREISKPFGLPGKYWEMWWSTPKSSKYSMIADTTQSDFTKWSKPASSTFSTPVLVKPWSISSTSIERWLRKRSIIRRPSTTVSRLLVIVRMWKHPGWTKFWRSTKLHTGKTRIRISFIRCGPRETSVCLSSVLWILIIGSIASRTFWTCRKCTGRC